jgi:hypothetical protein
VNEYLSPVSLTPAINCLAVSTIPAKNLSRENNQKAKKFSPESTTLPKICSPVSTTPLINYSKKIRNGSNGILRGPGTLIYEKNLMSKISCQTPFKQIISRICLLFRM